MKIVDAVVVGAGPSGLRAAQLLSEEGLSFCLLESEDRIGGRSVAGLHLTQTEPSPPFVSSKKYSKARIRWNREWVSKEDVPWAGKKENWATPYLPQWDYYLDSDLGLIEEELLVPSEWDLQLSCPVTELLKEDGRWILKTPTEKYSCSRVFWSAGITAFQNAVGKRESQKFLQDNPGFDDRSRDAVGGLSLDWQLKNPPEFIEGFDASAVFGLSLKHQGKNYFLIGVASVQETAVGLKTLIYLPDEIIKSPKETLSIQKSIKRGLRYLFKDPNAVDNKESEEKWFANARMSGASLALKKLLASSEGLIFIGDESLQAAQEYPHSQLLSAQVVATQAF